MPIYRSEEDDETQQQNLSDAQLRAEEATLKYKALLLAIADIAPDKSAEILAALPDYIDGLMDEQRRAVNGTKGISE